MNTTLEAPTPILAPIPTRPNITVPNIAYAAIATFIATYAIINTTPQVTLIVVGMLAAGFAGLQWCAAKGQVSEGVIAAFVGLAGIGIITAALAVTMTAIRCIGTLGC